MTSEPVFNLEQTGEIEKVRHEQRAGVKRSAYFYLVMIMTVILAAGSSMFVTVKLTERSERKLCDVVIGSMEEYRRVPPTTEAGKNQAANWLRLSVKLGCVQQQATETEEN